VDEENQGGNTNAMSAAFKFCQTGLFQSYYKGESLEIFAAAYLHAIFALICQSD